MSQESRVLRRLKPEIKVEISQVRKSSPGESAGQVETILRFKPNQVSKSRRVKSASHVDTSQVQLKTQVETSQDNLTVYWFFFASYWNSWWILKISNFHLFSNLRQKKSCPQNFSSWTSVSCSLHEKLRLFQFDFDIFEAKSCHIAIIFYENFSCKLSAKKFKQ